MHMRLLTKRTIFAGLDHLQPQAPIIINNTTAKSLYYEIQKK